MRQYLVLEDNQEFVEQNYKTAERDSSTGDAPFSLVYVSTVADAKTKLATNRFYGAILDLRLSNDPEAQGNEVAKSIHSDHFIPIAIVTGVPDELDDGIRALTGENSLIKVFNKSGLIGLVFEFLFKIEHSGLLQIVGPGGEVNRMLSDIFWKHLGPVLAQRAEQPMSPLDRKRVLRHAVAHMMGALQSNEPGTWDKYLPAEVYIWPAICPNEMTGDILVEVNNGQETDAFWLLVTPSCDLASKSVSGALRHFIRIFPFSGYANEGKIGNLIGKKEHRFHVLPPAPGFNGGVVDFATIRTVFAADVDASFKRKGSLIEPYWREIINRLGAWLARQGTPEFDKNLLMASIRQQWPVVTNPLN
jgi:hypothetical protein